MFYLGWKYVIETFNPDWNSSRCIRIQFYAYYWGIRLKELKPRIQINDDKLKGNIFTVKWCWMKIRAGWSDERLMDFWAEGVCVCVCGRGPFTPTFECWTGGGASSQVKGQVRLHTFCILRYRRLLFHVSAVAMVTVKLGWIQFLAYKVLKKTFKT